MALPTGAPKPPRKVVRPGGGFPRLSAMRLANPRPDRNHLVAGRDLRHDPAMTKRVALYARCSTADRQTTENQIRDLRAVAEQHGWTVAGVFDVTASAAACRAARNGRRCNGCCAPSRGVRSAG